MIDQSAAQTLCQDVLQRCREAQAEVLLMAEDNRLTRFANNTIHQNVSESNLTLIVHLELDGRVGSATSNRLDPAGLDQLVELARANALASPPDPHFPGLAEPAIYPAVAGFDDQTAGYPADQRADAAGEVCRLAAERDLNASGAFATGSRQLAVANSLGLFAYHPATSADFQVTVMGSDSSGRAQASGWRAGELATESLGREAIRKAELAKSPRLVDAGEYAVVFDPYVTQDLVAMLNYHGIGAQAVLDGRSWMNERIGLLAMSPLVSLWDDGCDLRGLPSPFDYEGVPKQKVEIVRDGVVVGPVFDRVTARKAGVSSTGHALPPHMRMQGPVAANLFMAPGTAPTEELIASTHRGLYITRFWYTRLVHPRDCTITGMTRDGVYMIENGELAYPVKNLRFTQSYVQALADVEAVGCDTRLLAVEYSGMASHVPALKIGRFNFTGTTV
jgi:predicted Zn-dependent protease